MVKQLSILLYFMKELIFDSAEEHTFKSRKFNARKVVVFLLMVTSFSGNLLLAHRLFRIAEINVDLNAKLELIKLQDDICKNLPTLSSDSGKDAVLYIP